MINYIYNNKIKNNKMPLMPLKWREYYYKRNGGANII